MHKKQTVYDLNYRKKIKLIKFYLSLRDLEGINLPDDLKEVKKVAKDAILNRYRKEEINKNEKRL